MMAIAVVAIIVFASLFFGGLGFILTGGSIITGLVMFGVSCLLYGIIIGACIAGSDDLDL